MMKPQNLYDPQLTKKRGMNISESIVTGYMSESAEKFHVLRLQNRVKIFFPRASGSFFFSYLGYILTKNTHEHAKLT